MIYNLSARLKQLRQEKHLKQEQVALLVGVTKSAVSSWELDIEDSADFDPNAIISRGDFAKLVNGVLALYRAV